MSPVSRSKIGLQLEISLILFHIGVVGACTVSVLQPGYLEVDYTSETVTMECTFSTTECSSKQPRSLWFRCGTHQPEALCLDGCRNEADKFTVKEILDQNQVFLTVNRVSPNDSAIYICGIAFPHEVTPRAKQTGNGTTLVVRESLLGRHVHSLLIVLLTLLSVYTIGVCVIFIVFFKLKPNSPRSRDTKEDSQKMSARRIFREIAQELYHRRYVETSQQPVSIKQYLSLKRICCQQAVNNNFSFRKHSKCAYQRTCSAKSMANIFNSQRPPY
ncbi:immunoglobulin superfamily member 6 [Acomys russatus]|uniref:immunoglobulin superfamily member 6 n=1 Tax=Acomys russatus TaxID=60746 RepID=UPI0021E2D423|nr:immunoglobulin superfamily member 6 [Acomys russatus]